MKKPAFDVSAEGVVAYARMYDINIDGLDPSSLALQLAGGLAGLAFLRDRNVDGVEPFVTFPVDRVQK